MPMSLPNREAVPVVLETPEMVATFSQEGFGGQVDFFNMFTTAILIGEPLIYMDRLGISKFVVLAKEPGQLHFGAEANFIVDPALASAILAGHEVYFDLNLADSVVPGYATNVKPTKGYLLGHAVMDYDKNNMSLDVATGKPIACTTSQARVKVLMTQERMVLNKTFWGTGIPDVRDGDTTILSS